MQNKLHSILQSAFEKDVDILIFPELTVDHDAYTSIVDWLGDHNNPEKIKLVVAGSFHKQHAARGYVNRSTMLNYAGHVVWESRKRTPFATTGKYLKNSSDSTIDSKKVYAEKIQTDFLFVFADTPIGRMSTLICLDFLPGFDTVLKRVVCGYIFVPAMTTSITQFETAAGVYGEQHHVLSAICASKRIQGKMKMKDFSFVWAAITKLTPNHKLKKGSLFIYKIHEPR